MSSIKQSNVKQSKVQQSNVKRQTVQRQDNSRFLAKIRRRAVLVSHFCQNEKQMPRHIFLIGFMGSGKTHWGRAVAEKLGAPFLDLDHFIEENEGGTIPEIFADLGENGFRVLERENLLRLAAFPPTVVATGGGTPCFFDNMDWMKKHGTTIYLKTPPEVLFERLKNSKERRPLLAGKRDAELRGFIERLLAEREPHYLLAELTVNENRDDADLLNVLLQAATPPVF